MMIELKLLAEGVGSLLGILFLTHFTVLKHWDKRVKGMLEVAIRSLEGQSYKTVNEVRIEQGLTPLPPEQGGNMVLNRVLIDTMSKK